jgi:hypothetical protein
VSDESCYSARGGDAVVAHCEDQVSGAGRDWRPFEHINKPSQIRLQIGGEDFRKESDPLRDAGRGDPGREKAMLGVQAMKRTDPLEKDEFAQRVMDGIRKAGAVGEIAYDPKRYCLLLGDKDGPTLFLGNGYDEYCSAAETMQPQVLQKLVRAWFAGAIKLPEAFEDLHPDLLPTVRTRSYFDLALLNKGKAAVLPHQVLGEHLAVGLVYDLPQAMRTISQEDLDGWGVTFYEALEAARYNLMQLEHAFIGPKDGEGVYLSTGGDGYGSSRLILMDLIRRLRVAGNCIAMVPNPDTLIVTGAEDLNGLKGMLGLAAEALQKPRPISGVALRLDGDDWVTWLPDPAHPLHNEFRGLQLQSVARSYAEQKQALDVRKEDVFIASCFLVHDPESGQYMTYCAWPLALPAILPKTDQIAFMPSPDESPLMTQWNRAVEVVGDLMEPLDMYPERFRVSEFPTEEQLAALEGTMP